jgi:mannose-6-phosphate isomerase-like protein (cupin superfamily)
MVLKPEEFVTICSDYKTCSILFNSEKKIVIPNNISKIEKAELVLPCADLNENLNFFTGRLGFLLETIFPADNPVTAVINGFGMLIRLEKTDKKLNNEQIKINLRCASLEKVDQKDLELIAPNGVKIGFMEADPPLLLPELKSSFVLTKISENAEWVRGRAGMRYRDLIPDRQGGRFIASHIHIPKGGKVPDYVHYHHIHFQIIYCYRGWAKLVYEDQGEPFIFRTGECVLQPPQIRHRVLESSDNLEVIEFTCPAEHETFAEHQMNLPTSKLDPNKDFNGQKFHHYKPTERHFEKWRIPFFKSVNFGIGTATKGLAEIKFIRPFEEVSQDLYQHDAEFVFLFILHGKALLRRENSRTDVIQAGASVVIPAETGYNFSDPSDDFEMLEISLPAEFETRKFSSSLI